MTYVSDTVWKKYMDILRNFHDDAMQTDIIWRSTIVNRTRLSNETRSIEITLKGLIHYNYFRNWPINRIDNTGEVDQESLMLYLNQEYLGELGLLDSYDQFKFDPALDRFILEGMVYKGMGYSKAAQVKDKTAMIFIILQREELETTDNPIP